MNFTPPSDREVQQQIAALHQLDLKNCDVDFLKDQLTPLMRGFRIKSPALDRGLKIYRGVPWDAAPCNVRQIGYPCSTKIKDYQRANRPREQVKTPPPPCFDLPASASISQRLHGAFQI
jgi:hypothetical protein